MTLQEKISQIQINDGQYIHIGSNCGFFFVGTKDEYESGIDRISEKYRKAIEDKIRTSESRLNERRQFVLPDMNDLKLQSISVGAINKYCDSLLQFENDLRSKIKKEIRNVNITYNIYCNSKRALENFVHFKNRDVKEVYDRITGDGIVIIVYGDEMGDYWDRSEFISGYEEKITESITCQN